MSEPSGSRITISVGCSKQFKERVQAAAAARQQSVSDWCVEALSDALQFSTFVADTDKQAAQDDWETMAELSRDGKQIP